MKALAVSILCLALVALADDFKTINGKEYKNVKVSRVEQDGVVVITKDGISKIYFPELPQEIQQKYGYAPAFPAAAAPAPGPKDSRDIPESAAPESSKTDTDHVAPTRGLRNLGYLYETGKGVPQSYEKAAQLYEEAAQAGDARAEASLAKLYVHGWGVPRDYGRAFDLAQKSAAQDDPAGETNLGDMYHHGWGVKEDCNKAVALYTKAADQGYADALANLAALYMSGRCGVPHNPKMAAVLLEKAIAAKAYQEANEAAPNTQPH